MRFLIGIDDTDSSNSRGTGNLARELGDVLQHLPGVRLLEITRHQLLINPLVSYTTQNGCICLAVDTESRDGRELELECRSFLLHNSASGANAGMALAEISEVPAEIIEWGGLAKRQVLDRRTALDQCPDAEFGGPGLGLRLGLGGSGQHGDALCLGVGHDGFLRCRVKSSASGTGPAAAPQPPPCTARPGWSAMVASSRVRAACSARR